MKKSTLFTVGLQALLIVTGISCLGDENNPCVFEMKEGVINLTSVVNVAQSIKLNVIDKNLTINYNPCFDFSMQEENCMGVAVCVRNSSSGNLTFYENFGTASSLKSDISGKSLFLTYHSSNNKTRVEVVCSEDSEDARIEMGNITENQLNMALKTKCACANKCIVKPGTPPDNGLSTGSILVIILFVGTFVYLFGGILFLNVVKGATGFESVPHYEFWTDLPLLIRDGIVFSMNCCKPQVVYDRI